VLDGPFKKSFIYRNVNAEYANRATFRSALRMYDQIVAPHAQDESSRGGFAAHDGELMLSGEVIQFEHDDLLPPGVARAQLGIPTDKRLVYLSAGGGGDPSAETQLRSLIDNLSDLNHVQLLVGAGPLYRGGRLSGTNVTWFDGPSIAKYFSALDAAVSAAGYNTFHELLYARVPTAFFSQEKIADDQSARIQKALAAGACKSLDDVADRESVVTTVQDLLHGDTANQLRTACEKQLPTNGASRCAVELLRPLYGDQRFHWAKSVLTPRLAHRLEQLSDSSTIVADWLVPLVPEDQSQTIGSHPRLDAIIRQLSPSAASEMQQALSKENNPSDHARIESKLIELFDAFGNWPDIDRRRIADASLKTIVATMKKQPLQGELENQWASWIGEIIDAARSMIAFDAGSENAVSSVIDRLRLFRAFPRVVDADVSASADLFRQFLSDHSSRGASLHEIDQAIQLLKLTHSRVTKSLLEQTPDRIAPRRMTEPTQ
ncbi:MAG: hypothetical protein HKN47_14750, partial [Pirellulaceae bacterium]|nr:hypothetical protein [Pirellulaceae bacterium]